jgi:copper(I)-binding protein
MIFRTLAAVLAASVSFSAAAAGYSAGAIHIDNAWARATAPGQSTGGAYLSIANDGSTADRLLAVKSDVAERVEVHRTQTQGGVSSMSEVDAVDVPANGKVTFAPGGYHIMFIKLKAPFTAGGEVPATLVFEKAGALPMKFEIKPIAYDPGNADGKGGTHMDSMHMDSMHSGAH